VLGFLDAEHEETSPGSTNLVISKLTCSLAGQTQKIKLVPGTLIRQLYGEEDPLEKFLCNYGLNLEYQDKIALGELKVSGVDFNGEVRSIELSDHRFFIATLFMPQLSSSLERPHPLIVAYLKAALISRTTRRF
jgi:CTP synthase (UTP-ammonia lyase)